jgi:zinc/manganese transport system ATP-binding protein
LSSATVGTAPAVQLDGVAVTLGGRTIWHGASFDLGRGEFAGIVGPNGSGKTTLLRLVLGQLRPSAGRVTVLGGAPHLGNRAVGLVPQRRQLVSDLAVRGRDLVLLGLVGHRWGFGRASAAEQQQVADALAAVGATDYADEPIGVLSGGQQQRLLIAQALVNDVQLLLLDEPLASLDVRSGHEVITLATDICRQRGVTTLIVTHDLNPLLPTLDRIVYILDRQPCCGTVDEVVCDDLLSRLYGTPLRVLQTPDGERFVQGA